MSFITPERRETQLKSKTRNELLEERQLRICDKADDAEAHKNQSEGEKMKLKLVC